MTNWGASLTASMIRSGKCYQNLMVDLKPTNMKLVARAARIVTQATGCTTEQAQEVLKLTGNDVKLAILTTLTGMPLKRAKIALESAGGFLRKARRRPLSPRCSGGASPMFLHFSFRTRSAPTGVRVARLGASIAPGGYRDEVAVVRDLKAPLAVLHGGEEQLINGTYFASLAMPTLWRGAVQTIRGAGHTPQWETPDAFDVLLEAFMAETA